jgi:hypothetical protein
MTVFVLVLGLAATTGAQRAAVSNKPDTPFKLATFEAAGKTRVGLVLGSRRASRPFASPARCAS